VKFKNVFPKKFHLSVEDYAVKINEILGSYLRGALIVCIINAVVITTFLSILGVQYSFVLGILSGLFCFIPYFGVLISFSIGFIVALFSDLSSISLLFIPLIYFGQNLLESSIFYPKIVGSQIGMHPALLILSLFVFSYFFGLVGMLIAVPAASIILLIVRERIAKRDLSSI
jgi:predicted PurR-regulated permease PerM